MVTMESLRGILEQAGLLPLSAQAELSGRVLAQRLRTVLPWAMEQSGIDFYVVMSRENCEDPVLKTLMTWDMRQARRLSVLMFYRDPGSGTVRCMSAGNQSPEMSRFYENVLQSGETPLTCAARMARTLNVKAIGVNTSSVFGYCDGLTATLDAELRAALPPELRRRIVSAEKLAVRFLQRQCPLEREIQAALLAVTQGITEICYSPEWIVPGQTSTTDIEWHMRELFSALSLDYWFGPDVDLQRRGCSDSRLAPAVLRPGDLVHCDVGVRAKYIPMHTDMQWLLYLRKPGENDAPEELRKLLQAGNRFQDLVMAQFEEGKTGNEIFAAALDAAGKNGLKAMLYSHPLGTYGHGAGPAIGRYDLQGFVPGPGEYPLEAQTGYALELNVRMPVAAWDNQEVYAYLEEDIFFDGEKAEFVRPRQERLFLV
jgi:hypothetical protein